MRFFCIAARTPDGEIVFPAIQLVMIITMKNAQFKCAAQKQRQGGVIGLKNAAWPHSIKNRISSHAVFFTMRKIPDCSGFVKPVSGRACFIITPLTTSKRGLEKWRF
jgi:hypothetical protein